MALVNTGLHGKRRSNIVNFFQGQPSLCKEYMGEPISDILTGTGCLLDTGWNLTRASKLIMINPGWLQKENMQVGKRINRIGASVPTTQFLLSCLYSQIEQIIYDRHKGRAAITEIALMGREVPVEENNESESGEEV